MRLDNFDPLFNDFKENTINCETSIFDYFFKSVGIISVGFMFSFYFISLIYKKDFLFEKFNKNDYNSDFDHDEEDEYEKKYYEDFKKLENKELTDEDKELLKKRILYEDTPDGEVIIYYNNDTESFYYWCDNKNIKYMFLNSVVYKYAVEYNCKSVCVDYTSELKCIEKEYEKLQKSKSEEKNKETNEDVNENNDVNENDNQNEDVNENVNEDLNNKEKNVFVKFKNYSNQQNTNNNTSNSKYLVTKSSNRFSYRGNIKEYYKSKNKSINLKEEKKNISYSDFKKSNNQ